MKKIFTPLGRRVIIQMMLTHETEQFAVTAAGVAAAMGCTLRRQCRRGPQPWPKNGQDNLGLWVETWEGIPEHAGQSYKSYHIIRHAGQRIDLAATVAQIVEALMKQVDATLGPPVPRRDKERSP